MYKTFRRHSPNALAVSEHLGIDIQIDSNDYICTSCYKTHSSIIKSLEQSKQHGSDSTLKDSIEIWEQTAKNSQDLATKATLAAVMYIAKHLLQKNLYSYHGHVRYFYKLMV